ncbi:MAG: HD-GYP domain-containing protein [Vallitaleaceae bacterium]|nr:HD-GYP domain-containing protein [Vallitaleaceae bacterium]
MTSKSKTRIPVNHIQAGMKIAEDLYTPKGLMLIPINTVIDEKHIFRIRLYQIISILVYEEEYDNFVENSGISENQRSYFEKQIAQNFTDFKERYIVQHQQTQAKLDSICKGEAIKEDDLFDVTTLLIDSLRTKSDLFNYMYHLKIDDDYTYTHCLNVSVLANIFAKWLKLSNEEIREVTIAGLLHDIGKMSLDYEILNKPGKLTKEEFDHVKLHSKYGYDIIKNQSVSDSIKNGVLFHHEKLDGSGYPLGLKDSQIPLYAKIIGIADIYDAMTSKRCYHDKYSPFRVIKMFEQESYGLLDTKLLFVFLENIAHNYLGKDVLLSTGERAKIVFIHNQSPSRPIVQVNQTMVDLMVEPDIQIDEIL